MEITASRLSLFIDVVAAVTSVRQCQTFAADENPRGLSWPRTKEVLRSRCQWTDAVFNGLHGPYPSLQRWSGGWKGLFTSRTTLRDHASCCSATYRLHAIGMVRSEEFDAHERLARMIASGELTEADFKG